jgi:hypothetical protein
MFINVQRLAQAMAMVAAVLRRLGYALRFSLGNAPFHVLLFGVLFQAGHMFEHVAQMYQFLVLGRPVQESHGILASADLESVHFLANLIVLLVFLVVYFGWQFNRADATLRQFRDLTIIVRVAILVQGYHVVEHTARYIQHLQSGAQGQPGFIGQLVGPNLIHVHFWLGLFAFSGLVLLLVLYLWHMQVYPAYLETRARHRIKGLMRLAAADGTLSGDERMILVRLRHDTELFARELLQRLQAGQPTSAVERRLVAMQRALLRSAEAQARVDGRITGEEHRLLVALERTNPVADVLAKLRELRDQDHVPDTPAPSAVPPAGSTKTARTRGERGPTTPRRATPAGKTGRSGRRRASHD